MGKRGDERKRLALVAGGSGFLGGAVATELARRGWFVGVHFFRGRERAEAVVQAIRAHCQRAGGEACVLSGDLTVGDEAERVAAEFEKAAERLLGTPPGRPPELVVVATGVVRDAPLLRTSEADWDAVVAANLLAPVNVLRAAALKWQTTGGGHAILIGSYAGLVELGGGRAGGAAYSASKAALVGLARSLARELGPAGVRVNVVIPPLVTQGMGTGASAEFIEEMRSRSVLGRTGDAEEFARFVADLAETEGVSGQVLGADSRIAGL